VKKRHEGKTIGVTQRGVERDCIYKNRVMEWARNIVGEKEGKLGAGEGKLGRRD